MLVVSGGSAVNAVVRGPAGEPVVLLSGELPDVLDDRTAGELLDLAAAVLSADEARIFSACLAAFRRGEGRSRRIEIDGRVLTVHDG